MNTNNLELNKGDNFIFGVDVSGSMSAADCPGNMARIDFLKEKVIAFCGEAAKYDDDGIDVIAFGHQVRAFKGVTPEKATQVINGLKADEAATRTDQLIREAWKLHREGKYEQTVLFIATDGDPTDKEAVKQVISDITHQVQDEREFNISFLTVGTPTPALSQFLTGLDDDLKGAKYDIVDVKKLEEVDFVTAFAGALND